MQMTGREVPVDQERADPVCGPPHPDHKRDDLGGYLEAPRTPAAVSNRRAGSGCSPILKASPCYSESAMCNLPERGSLRGSPSS
jgi:hypothetical protein